MTAPLKVGPFPMIRVSLSYIFELANKMEPLSRLPETDTPYKEIFISLLVADGAIESLHSQTLYSAYLRSSFQLAQLLLAAIRQETTIQDFNHISNRANIWQIKNLYGQYRTALLAELGVMHSYFVTQKRGFDTISLLFFGENLFPSDLGQKTPEALFDAKESGKCLAYETPTACGFHVFRATESVLRRYYARVTGGAAAPKVRSINVYVKAIRRAGKGDPKVLAVLNQIADLHRNPLVHPETILTQDEAIAVFGVAVSAITAMLAVLPIIPPTTTGLPSGSIATTMASVTSGLGATP